MQHIFTMTPIAPFRLDYTVWALRRRAYNNVDRWDGCVYRRIFRFNDEFVDVAVTQEGTPESPALLVKLSSETTKGFEPVLKDSLKRVFGTEKDLSEFYALSSADPDLRLLVKRFLGLKPPLFPSVFEAAVNGIACQQITLTLGIHLLNRLAMKYGEMAENKHATAHAFPRPEDLASLDPDALRPLGFTNKKSENIVGLSREIVAGRLDLEALQRCGNEQAIEVLQGIRGIGPWTADYVLLRGLGRLNVFPRGDVGAAHRLAEFLGHAKEKNQQEKTEHLLGEWKPFAGMVYFHLLLKHLSEENIL